MPEHVPLVDELASVLNALLSGQVDQRAEAIAAMERYELERDRSDLDAVSLPARVVVVMEDGQITSTLTDFAGSIQLTVVDYIEVEEGWCQNSYAQIPQTDGETEPAHAFHVIPTQLPVRVAEICQAVFVADCASPSKH